MKYLVSAEEMRRYDSHTIDKIGIPGMVLMERAALTARDRVLAALRREETQAPDAGAEVLVMAGMGNNGGDGLALARLLSDEGLPVTVWCVGDARKASEQWTWQKHILEHYQIRFCDTPDRERYAVLVDALFGVGLSRSVEGAYGEAVSRFNALRGFKIALDIPSGICSDTGRVLGCAVQADATVTFGFAKRGLYLYPGRRYAGEIQVADIGIPESVFGDGGPELFCLDQMEDAARWLPGRAADGNKGTFGKVLFVAGSEGMAGAAVLGAKAACRSGAGMVKVVTDACNRTIVQSAVPEALYGTYEEVEESARWADVIVAGPGLGRSDAACACLETVFGRTDKPLLIDADGLNLLAERERLRNLLAESEREVVLTPHVGELSRLTGLSADELKEALWRHGKSLAGRFHAVVVAKDARTFVCAPGHPVCMNIHGNSGMATAGSGDVLAGMIAGIWAQLLRDGDGQRMDSGSRDVRPPAFSTAFRAACLGVRLHAAAGDLAAAERGEYGCMAGDLAEAAARVLRDVPADTRI
ncbi:MAG: NAD(P)H-hydrate dehydratase [Muribaculum sp.]|nr:NAD(P)H-hydrate dehydratase [Muribaculum sp.]